MSKEPSDDLLEFIRAATKNVKTIKLDDSVLLTPYNEQMRELKRTNIKACQVPPRPFLKGKRATMFVIDDPITMPQSVDWTAPWLKELVELPDRENDDQVDPLLYALTALKNARRRRWIRRIQWCALGVLFVALLWWFGALPWGPE